MKMSEISKVLSESLGDITYEVTIPSTQETYTCNMMTAGMFKTISKYAVSDSSKGAFKFQLAKMSLIETLSNGSIDTSKLTVPDFVSVMSQIMANNLMTPVTFDVVCPACGESYTYEMDFPTYIDNCDNYVYAVHEFNITDEITAVDYTFTLSDPRARDNVDIEGLISTGKLTEDKRDQIVPLTYISGLSVNGVDIEDFTDNNIFDRITFLVNNVSPSVLFGESSLSDEINKKFKEYEFITPPKCGECSHEIKYAITVDNFFLM